MKSPQTKFHAHTTRESQLIRSKKTKFNIRSKFIVRWNLCSIHCVYSVTTLWCSRVWLHCSYSRTCQYIILEATLFFVISKHRVHEYASGLTSIPKAELFWSCKYRKCTRQNEVKF